MTRRAATAITSTRLTTAGRLAYQNGDGAGDMPTTGGARPGPVGIAVPARRRAAVAGRPVAMRITKIQVDTEIQRAFIVDGAMENPSGPFVVAWYGALGRLGEPGNAVFSGHLDYVGVGPAVFWRLGELGEGDRIEITGLTNDVYAYDVDWLRAYPYQDAPVDEILAQGDAEEITLITCAGVFDTGLGTYPDRLILRAVRGG